MEYRGGSAFIIGNNRQGEFPVDAEPFLNRFRGIVRASHEFSLASRTAITFTQAMQGGTVGGSAIEAGKAFQNPSPDLPVPEFQQNNQLKRCRNKGKGAVKVLRLPDGSREAIE